MSDGSRRALCIGVGSFTPVGAGGGDEPDLTPFEGLEYAAECTRGLHAVLRVAGYDGELVVDPAVLGEKQLGERVERHLDAIARRARPAVVVVDAVDEAPDHQQLVDQLLIPLAGPVAVTAHRRAGCWSGCGRGWSSGHCSTLPATSGR